jgi:hypothetical protein
VLHLDPNMQRESYQRPMNIIRQDHLVVSVNNKSLDVCTLCIRTLWLVIGGFKACVALARPTFKLCSATPYIYLRRGSTKMTVRYLANNQNETSSPREYYWTDINNKNTQHLWERNLVFGEQLELFNVIPTVPQTLGVLHWH